MIEVTDLIISAIRPFRLRLIDVNERCIRLFEEYDPSDSHAAFAALSYVWGRKPQKLLLTAEKEPMLTKPGVIGNNNVSQTIYDAIEVTKSLGLVYLWVDAICIRQGKTPEDERDKAEQIGNSESHRFLARQCRSASLQVHASKTDTHTLRLSGRNLQICFPYYCCCFWKGCGGRVSWAAPRHALISTAGDCSDTTRPGSARPVSVERLQTNPETFRRVFRYAR